jgi:FG-GAP-like repeat/ASPIC and UnbV
LRLVLNMRRPSSNDVLAVIAAIAFGLGASVAPAQIAFTDATNTAGVAHSSESYGASWGDLDGDGYPDLFASNHRTQPSLFLNLGNGSFRDIATKTADWLSRPGADTHGASWADFDNDGDQDLMVSVGTGNPSQFLVNENQQLIDRTAEFGLDFSNLGGRLPVWLDYDNDHRLDVVVTQYGGIAKLFHQNAGGGFTETTSSAKLLCIRFHYAQLFDANGDGRLDFLCPDESAFPQKIYDTSSFPWKKLFDSAQPSAFFPLVNNVADSAIADFNNDGRMDLFVLGGVQLRPSSVAQEGTKIEALLAGGSKGFKFVTSGSVTFTIDWNKADEGDGTTDITKIQIGAHGTHPKAVQFTLDPNDPTVAGMPPAPTSATTLPIMQVGYNNTTHQWTLAIVTKLTSTSPEIFSQGYMQVSSTAAISGLVATGLWPTDLPGRPTLLMNRPGNFVDETVAAGLDTPVQCSSVTAGDFDNDMYVDLYLACRTGASNIANILYHNNGNGTFTAVPNAGGAAGPIGLAIADGAGTADSVVTADYDVDGFLDLFVTNGFNLQPRYIGGPNKLFHNNGNANHWIELDLIGVNSDRDATGTRVYATANGVTQLRVQDGRYHRWSQDAKRIHFGLAGAQSVSLTVNWPSGSTQTFANVAANRLYQITEGGANPVPVALRVAPTPPTGLEATAGNGSVQLTWTAAPGAMSYNVYQGTTAGGEGTTAVMTAVTGTSVNVTPLANGTTYYFVVSADTTAGSSGPSPEVSATPAASASGGGGNAGGGGGGGGAIDLWSLLGIAVFGAMRRRDKRSRVST